jgi:hypothetical protein
MISILRILTPLRKDLTKNSNGWLKLKKNLKMDTLNQHFLKLKGIIEKVMKDQGW